MKLRYIIEYLDDFLQSALFRDYCENGLQFGDPEKIVSKIALGVTADLATIRAASNFKADLLITHHGLFWKGEPQKITGYKHKRVAALIESNMSLLVYHLPLDAHREVGNNWKVALDLGWSDLKSFGRDGPQLGVAGHFPHMMHEDLIRRFEEYYSTKIKASVIGLKTPVTSAALIAGNGYKEIVTAANEGYDCLITGSFDEPAWSLAHETGTGFLAFGHTATEKIGPKALAAKLSETLNLPTVFIDTENAF